MKKWLTAIICVYILSRLINFGIPVRSSLERLGKFFFAIFAKYHSKFHSGNFKQAHSLIESMIV